MEEPPIEPMEFDPIEFQLCNGNQVKIAVGHFWERLTDEDRRNHVQPAQYLAIRVYSTEDVLPRALALQWEFRGGVEFSIEALPKIWGWLLALVDSRNYREYDWFDEFLEDFGEQIGFLSEEEEDTAEHFEHLPEIAIPEAFDRVDDSIFNDQNEPSRPDNG